MVYLVVKMVIRKGDTVKLNKKLGRYKKGDTFIIDNEGADLIFGYSTKTGTRISLYKGSSSVSIINKEDGLYV